MSTDTVAGDESTAINDLIQGMGRRLDPDPVDRIVKWDHPGPEPQGEVSLRGARSFRMVTAPVGVKTGIPPIVKQVIQQHRTQPPAEDEEVTRFVHRTPTPVPPPPERMPSRPAIAVAIARRLAVPMIGVALASAVVTYVVMRSRATTAAPAAAAAPVAAAEPPAPTPAPAKVTVTPIPAPAPAPAPETPPVAPPTEATPAEAAPVATETEPAETKPAEQVAEAKPESEVSESRDDRERERRRAKRRARAEESGALVATEPAADEPPPRDQPTGLLMVSTKPPCKIVIDGKPTGLVTPQRAIRLTPGSHRIELINEDEAIRSSTTVDISSDQPTKLIRNFMLSTHR